MPAVVRAEQGRDEEARDGPDEDPHHGLAEHQQA
jgi:hypothetical protein